VNNVYEGDTNEDTDESATLSQKLDKLKELLLSLDDNHAREEEIKASSVIFIMGGLDRNVLGTNVGDEERTWCWTWNGGS
jgi:hypothetical protein